MKCPIIFQTLWQEKWQELPSPKAIASQLNWDKSSISGFLQEKQELRPHLFLELVAQMPVDFKLEYWRRIAKEVELITSPSSLYCQGQNKEYVVERMTEILEIVKALGINVKKLLELLEDIPKAVQASIPSIMMINNCVAMEAGQELIKMIRHCVEGKTTTELKEQMEFICPQEINWEILQEMLKGKRYPQSKIEVQELKMLVDPPKRGVTEKYSIFKWMGVFGVFDRTIQGFGNQPPLEPLI